MGTLPLGGGVYVSACRGVVCGIRARSCVVVSMAVAVCAVACLSVRVSPSRGGLPLCHACVWAENDSRVVWFVKLGVS